MITQELEENINAVRIDARRRQLDAITIEHLTLVLITENTAVREFLLDSQSDIDGLTRHLLEFLTTRIPTNRLPRTEPKPTGSFQRVLKRAISKTAKNGEHAKKITGVHVLVAIFAEPDSHAAYYMQKYGVERLELLAWLAKQTTDKAAPKTASDEKKSGSDLTDLAVNKRLDRPFGREQETVTLMQILCRKYKNNPLLVGEPGVGKTTLAHALAHRIIDRDAPQSMHAVRLLQISVADMVAGTKYRGDFEQRVQQIVAQCRQHGNTVLFIDEIHTLIGAGSVSGNALDAANILKPLLGEQSMRIIGATTFAEYRRIFEKDAALARRFQKMEIHEPDAATLHTILQGTITRLGAYHNVAYADDAAAVAVSLSRRYLPNRFLPDKAIDLLDDAGAARQFAERETPVGQDELTAVALRLAGLSAAAADNDKTQLKHLAAKLSEKVLAQEEAAERLAKAVLRGQLGFHNNDKTVGAFLFSGPTGVGKTEMARQLAAILGVSLLRYDMSEYMERHAVSRLIGAPPGYVGFEQSGKLVEDIFRHPNGIILFDEVEKAHPDVLNILLQILDYGKLTDNNGRTADFSNVIIILTSNLGAAEIERGGGGFIREESAPLAEEAVNRFFPPEFRNRLDAVIRFHPLSADTVQQIIDRRIQQLQADLFKKKGFRIRVSGKMKTRLKNDSYQKKMGARPLERLLCERLLEPLALADANNELHANGVYTLHDDDGVISVRPTKTRQRAAVPA